jgi:hypothetical protein
MYWIRVARDKAYRLAVSEPGSHLAGLDIALIFLWNSKLYSVLKRAYSEPDESSSYLRILVPQYPSKYPFIYA